MSNNYVDSVLIVDSTWIKPPRFLTLTLRKHIKLTKTRTINTITGCESHIQEQDWKTPTHYTDLHVLESHVGFFIFFRGTVKRNSCDEIKAHHLGVNISWQKSSVVIKLSLDFLQKMLKMEMSLFSFVFSYIFPIWLFKDQPCAAPPLSIDLGEQPKTWLQLQ